MNIKLIDSLVQIIESLTSEENIVLQEKLQARSIQTTSNICGGNARIRNTRIPVWTLVSFRQQGAYEAELLHNYPTLTQMDLDAAWSYYNSHHAEIDQVIVSHNEDDEKN